ncbi:MAG: 16S rRNA (adenine(1518)-N(6)/adenine(1519)-N(6))-dimethyltransferase RsmA [bacterium]|nr:16S rRNA (adenine(1518)-N(6)/adenine(1519)-N(6))-dimethyltransferase RsmA [bacterium]
MDLTNPKEIKELLSKYQGRPDKLMGQNFLVDKPALEKIIGASQLTPEDTVLEIGPGIGTLTHELAGKVKKVIAIEKDAAMIEILKETLKNYQNIEITQGDILKIGNWILDIGNYKIVANIPYYLTSHLIRQFLESKNPPKVMILMVQKEVAQRICAKPPKMSILALSVQFYATPEIISYVKKECFWPSPKVDSAIIKITPKPSTQQYTSINSDSFFNVVKAGFSHPRKQLAGNLSKALNMEKKQAQEWLLKNNVQPQQRAETLHIEDWVKLVDSLGN